MAGRVRHRNLGSVLVFICAALLGLCAVTAYDALHRPGPLAQSTFVVIPRGAGVSEIAATLQRSRVIPSALLFEFAARAGGRNAPLRAGEYAFSPRVSLKEVIAALRAGRTVVRKLTVPEGLTSRQVVALVAGAPALDGAVAAVPANGTLLPETYHYSYGDGRQALLARMAAAMTETVRELWAKRAVDLPLNSPQEAITLASIVEKETARPEERGRIAGVFINRLRLGMRLQADPTVAFALEDSRRGEDEAERPLSAADLQTPSPYNTYLNDGLPPGPIANPGRAALAAVLQPAKTDDLYFVADGTGGHSFARTLAEHNKNVQRWRRLQHPSTP